MLWEKQMRIFRQLVIACVCLVCSRALLEVAHAAGWNPETQLAKLFLASPMLLDVLWIRWLVLALCAIALWLAIEGLIYRDRFRSMFMEAFSRATRTPYVPGTPGLHFIKLKKGWKAEWRAPPRATRQGYVPKRARLFFGQLHEYRDPVAVAFLQSRSNILQDEMEQFCRDREGPPMEEVLASIRRIISDEEARPAK